MSLSVQFDINTNVGILNGEAGEDNYLSVLSLPFSIINFDQAKHSEISVMYYSIYCITIIYKSDGSI